MVPGLLVVATSWIWAAVSGATGVWGDALPWVMLFWLGFVLTALGGIVGWVIRSR